MPSQLPPPTSRLTAIALTAITLLPSLSLSDSAITVTMPKKLFTTSNTTTTIPSLPTPIPSTFLDNLPLPSILVFDLDYTLWPFWVDTHCREPLKPAMSTKTPTAESYNSAMLDRYNESFSFYSQVPTILAAARARGITMSVASRTDAPDLATQMLRGLYVPPLRAQEESSSKIESQPQSQPQPRTQAESANGYAIYTNGTSQQQQQQPLTLADLHTIETTPLRALSFFTYPQMYPGSKVRHFLEIQKQTRKHGGKDGEVAFADMIFFDDESRNKDVERELGVTFVLVRDGVTVDEVDRGVREWRRRRGVQVQSGS